MLSAAAAAESIESSIKDGNGASLIRGRGHETFEAQAKLFRFELHFTILRTDRQQFVAMTYGELCASPPSWQRGWSSRTSARRVPPAVQSVYFAKAYGASLRS